jgi:dolichol-phosphate mannosyltransferase
MLLIFSFVLGIQTIFVYLSGRAVEGFTTIIILVLLIGGILAGALGVIGEYLARIYEEVKGRPSFIVAERKSLAADVVES